MPNVRAHSLIPIVAIIGGDVGANDVAIWAILGAPLLLATIAMALVGVAARIFRDRRPQQLACNVHFPTLERDLGFFMGCFTVGLLLGLGAPKELQTPGAVLPRSRLQRVRTLDAPAQRGCRGRGAA